MAQLEVQRRMNYGLLRKRWEGEPTLSERRYWWDVFISYSHDDKNAVFPFAEHLTEILEKSAISVYLDRVDRPTEHVDGLEIALSESLARCRIFLPCVTESYGESEWCCNELAAFQQLRYDASISESTKHREYAKHLDIVPVFIDSRSPPEFSRKLVKLEMMMRYYHLVVLPNPNSPTLIEPTTSIPIKEITYTASGAIEARGHPFFTVGFYLDQMNHRELARRVADTITAKLKNAKSLESQESFSPGTLWTTFWEEYGYRSVADKIDIYRLLNRLNPPTHFSSESKRFIRLYSQGDLIALFREISEESGFMLRFSNLLAHEWSISATPKGLKFALRVGDPVAILVADIKDHLMLRQLQYSYYAFLEIEGRDQLVDVSVLAGLLMNIYQFLEPSLNLTQIDSWVVKPLSNGQDIQAGWSG